MLDPKVSLTLTNEGAIDTAHRSLAPSVWRKIPFRYTLLLIPGTKWIPGHPKCMSAKLIASKCPIEELFVLIGARWKPVILWWLVESGRPLRFKALRQKMPRISQKVLTQQLRELERDGLIKREMFAEMPVRVEYSVTSFGRKLRPLLRALDAWSRKYVVRKLHSHLPS